MGYNTLSENMYNDIFERLGDDIKDKYENNINQDILDIIKNVDSLSGLQQFVTCKQPLKPYK